MRSHDSHNDSQPSAGNAAGPAAQPTIDPKRRYRCRHVFTEGHRCGSPSLRGQELCYYHHASRRQASLAGHNGYFLMPRIDDRPAIQIALYDVLSRLSQFDIDPKRAGMLLYGLQIASSNLAKHEKSAANSEPVVEDIVSNPLLGDLAPIAEIPDDAEMSPAPQTDTPSTTAAVSVPPQNPVILSEARSVQPKDPEVIHTPKEHATLPPQKNPVILSEARSAKPKDPEAIHTAKEHATLPPKNPVIPSEASQRSEGAQPKDTSPAPWHPTGSHEPASLSPITLAAVQACANLQLAADTLQPATSEPSPAPPPVHHPQRLTIFSNDVA